MAEDDIGGSLGAGRREVNTRCGSLWSAKRDDVLFLERAAPSRALSAARIVTDGWHDREDDQGRNHSTSGVVAVSLVEGRVVASQAGSGLVVIGVQGGCSGVDRVRLPQSRLRDGYTKQNQRSELSKEPISTKSRCTVRLR